MNRLVIFLLILVTLFSFGELNSQTKITELPSKTTPTGETSFLVSYDSSGAWYSRRMTWAQVVDAMADSIIDNSTIKTSGGKIYINSNSFNQASTVNDTNSLKTALIDSYGDTRFLRRLSATASEETGGWFVWANTSYIENGGIAFSSNSGGQLVRIDYLIGSGAVNPKWWGAEVNDSANDLTAILKAVEAINDVGKGKLVLPDGTLNVNGATSIEISSYTEVIASAGSSIIFDKNSGVPGTGVPVFLVDNATDVVFDGLEIDGTTAIDSYSGQYDHGISVRDSRNITIRNCYIHDVGGDAIYFSDVDQSKVHDNKFSVPNLQTSPVFIGRNGFAIVEGSHVTVNNNIIVYGRPAGIDIEPNTGLTTTNINITNNDIDSCWVGINIDAISAGVTVTGVSINDNIITNCTEGIVAREITGWECINNQVSNNTNYGFYIYNETMNGVISGNRIYDNGQKGIAILDSCENIDILFNYIYNNNKEAIRCDGTSGNVIKNLRVIGNRSWDNGSDPDSTYAGIYITYAHKGVVLNNFSYDSAAPPNITYGLNVNNCDSLLISSNVNWGNLYGDVYSSSNTNCLFLANDFSTFTLSDLYLYDVPNELATLRMQSHYGSHKSLWWIIADTSADHLLIGANGATLPDFDEFPIDIAGNGIDSLHFKDGTVLYSGSFGDGSDFSDSARTADGKYDFDNFLDSSGLIDTTDTALNKTMWKAFIKRYAFYDDSLSATFTVLDSAADADSPPIFTAPYNIEILQVHGSTEIADSTVTFQLYTRAYTAAWSGGRAILSGSLQIDNDGNSTTSFNDADLAKGEQIAVDVVSGSTTSFTFTIWYKRRF